MLRPWEFNVEIDRNQDAAIHVQIAQKIIEEIQLGRFGPGSALPGSRELAKKIQVNRKTVIQAYDELISQGWLTSESKRGTFVSSRILAVSNLTPRRHGSVYPVKPHFNYEATPAPNKQQLHDTIDFSDGLPDSRLIPFEALSRAMRRALITSARNNKADYADPKGAPILRDAISQMLNMERSMHTKSNDICVVRGSQMGIFVIAKVLLESGDNVVVERLGNPQAREAFRNCGANIISVNLDANGIDVIHLEQLCQQHKISAVYVTPHHQIPTSVTMSRSRRDRLVELAEEYNFAIIEDDSDHEFNFTNHPAMPIVSNKNTPHVIYIGSLSKILTPDFRIGYIYASSDIVRLCSKQIMLIDRQGNQITELAIAELLHTGEIKKHILRAQKIYEERRVLLSDLLQEELGRFLNFKLAESGLAIWLEISSQININTLLIDAEHHKVHVQNGSIFCEQRSPQSAIRLGFAHLNHDETIQGVLRLKNAFSTQNTKLRKA